MTREQARNEINNNPHALLDYLTPSKGQNKFCCPICGSGTKASGTGALTFYPESNRFKCFACSDAPDSFGGKGQDVLGGLKVLWNATENEVFERLGYMTAGEPPRTPQSKPQAAEYKITIGTPQPPQKAPESDLRGYYEQCRENLLRSDKAKAYLQGRGISIETAISHGLGFDPMADPAGKGYKSARIITPTCSSHYVARAIDPQSKAPKLNNKGGTPHIFNAECLESGEKTPVFVCEGVFDALSVIEAGKDAISLNSTSNVKILLELLEKSHTRRPLVIALDNDDSGKGATADLLKGLERLKADYITADICGKSKDPNAALTDNRAAFFRAVEQAENAITRPDSVTAYIDTLMAAEIDKMKQSRDRRTGFENLDKLSGGIYSGLYVVAAISSLGKTTFSHQIADQMAEMGEDVLFFTLEQSRLELVTKSISRRTAQKNAETAVTSLSIRRGYLPEQVLEAAAEYKAAVADRLSIIEGNFDCTVSFIGEYVRRYTEKTGKKPVIFVDYLQIIQPERDERGRFPSAKEAVDHTITELKRLSREQGLTVFVISSVNRSNYLAPIDFESLKESGGIEYTADVIWGLQLKILNDESFSAAKTVREMREKVKQAKAETPRQIELVCLKNRYGISSFSAYFDYYPAHDLYKEREETGFTLDYSGIQSEKKKAKRR